MKITIFVYMLILLNKLLVPVLDNLFYWMQNILADKLLHEIYFVTITEQFLWKINCSSITSI